MTRSEISDALSKLYAEHEKLTPSIVVEAAKSKDSPLHGSFEWNDKKAGHEWRLVQARNLIRGTKIVFEGKVEELVHVPKLRFSTKDGGDSTESKREGYYVTTSAVDANDDEYQRALEEAMRDLDAAMARVGQLRRLRSADAARYDVALRSIEAAKLALQ